MARREKSVLYPSVTIAESIEFVKVVDSFKARTVSYSEVAKKYGLTSVTTKSFTQKIGSAKQYGLISTSNSTIRITDLCQQILYPTSDNQNVLKECFKLPPLYAALIKEYEGKAIPNEDILANLLMSKYEISRAAKNIAARVFIQNADELGLIKAGVFSCGCEAETNESGYIDNQREDINLLEDENVFQSQQMASRQTDKSVSGDYITQIFPVESGKIAKIIIPIDASEDDLYAIRDLLEVVMKRKFKIKLEN